MKNVIVAVFSAISLSWVSTMSVQGTLYVSNLEQTPTGDPAIGNDYRIAQYFNINASDTSQYSLNSIQLRLNPATGSPSGFAPIAA